MKKFAAAARRAVATFVFSSLSVLGLNDVFDIDAANWKLGLMTGIGALLNLAYRWAESAMKESGEIPPPEIPDTPYTEPDFEDFPED